MDLLIYEFMRKLFSLVIRKMPKTFEGAADSGSHIWALDKG
jgi:hypothetical protein